jgi:hypothetical protein
MRGRLSDWQSKRKKYAKNCRQRSFADAGTMIVFLRKPSKNKDL